MLALEHATLLALTEQAITRDPLRERGWSLHAVALARSGRQAEALDAIRRLRRLLDDELGLDPGPEVRDLESALLQQDDAVLTGWFGPTRPAAADAVPPGMQPRTRPSPTPPSTTAVVETRERPFVGRQSEREAIAQLLAAAREGQSGILRIVGEAGAGKSRLVDWAVTDATSRGMAAAVGTCSADDGAPPLWPWRQVFARLDLPPPPEPTHERVSDDAVAEIRPAHWVA